MMQRKYYFLWLFILCLCTCLISCNEHNKKSTAKEKTTPVIIKKDSLSSKKNEPTGNAPIINITDTVALRQNILYIKDSAATSIRLTEKLGQIYGMRLRTVMQQNKLSFVGAPVAWYRSAKAPFFFEAGLPVDKKPARLPKNILFKIIGGDSAVIAHFYGPYEQTSIAYDALNSWLKSHKKKLKSPAYEVYIGDPLDQRGNRVDPYKVQTDIIFPYN